MLTQALATSSAQAERYRQQLTYSEQEVERLEASNATLQHDLRESQADVTTLHAKLIAARAKDIQLEHDYHVCTDNLRNLQEAAHSVVNGHASHGLISSFAISYGDRSYFSKANHDAYTFGALIRWNSTAKRYEWQPPASKSGGTTNNSSPPHRVASVGSFQLQQGWEAPYAYVVNSYFIAMDGTPRNLPDISSHEWNTAPAMYYGQSLLVQNDLIGALFTLWQPVLDYLVPALNGM